MADVRELEDLVDRDALGEVCRSFFELFGLPIRVLGNDGALLADVHQQRAICPLLQRARPGPRGLRAHRRRRAAALVPEQTARSVHPCFTGAVYRVVPILYDGRRLGRIVVGPVPARRAARGACQPAAIDPGVDRERAPRSTSARCRACAPETAAQITAHLRACST